MKIFLEVLVIEEGKMQRFRFLTAELPVEQFDQSKHCATKFAWEELLSTEMIEKNIKVGQFKSAVRVWYTPEFTPEESTYLKKEGKIEWLSDLIEKTEVSYEGNN